MYIVAAKRTPFGTFGGKLTQQTATDLQEVASRAALTAAALPPEGVTSIVVGNVFHVSTRVCGWVRVRAVANPGSGWGLTTEENILQPPVQWRHSTVMSSAKTWDDASDGRPRDVSVVCGVQIHRVVPK